MVAGGGVVKYAIDAGIDATGFEEGWAADMGRLSGIPILCQSELDNYAGSFDFISAIEVLEHIPRPVEALLQIRKLLKPGGILFITTGNAQPWRQKLLDWGYTKCPDVHVSFYEPETLARCMKMTGFQSKEFRSLNGFVDIIKFKVLKTLRIKNQSKLIDALPWGLIAKLVDARHKVSKQPYGIAIED
jgi:SAM-dependent methyltransferase